MDKNRKAQPKLGDSINPADQWSEKETQYQKARKEALRKSPDIKKLSEPFICDNGRTLVYFKKGANVQKKGKEFEANRPIIKPLWHK
jgi:hypothetical protein